MPRKQNSENDLVVSRAAAAAPARRKPASAPRKQRTAPKATPVAALTKSEAVPTKFEAVAVSAVVVPVQNTEPTYEQIAGLAYAMWEARGCQGGSPEEDWLAAELQLRATK